MPYIWFIDSCAHDAFNAVVRTVAARHPGVVQRPRRWTPEIHQPGVVRWDGVHFTAAGADALAVGLVPELAASLLPPKSGVRPS